MEVVLSLEVVALFNKVKNIYSMTFQKLSRVAGAEHYVCSCSDRADMLVKMYVDK